MKKIITFFIVGLLAAGMMLFATACSQTQQNNQAESDTQSQDEQSSQNDTALEENAAAVANVSYEGRMVSVALAENGTTGYIWSYSLEGVGLEFDSEENLLDEGDSEMVGVGGTHIFRFQGSSVGASVITFTLSRPWEPAEQADQILVLVTSSEDGTILTANAISESSFTGMLNEETAEE